MKEEYKEFAHNLIVYMDYYGITKTELAKRTGVAQPTVTGWVKGERYPRFGVMLKLLDIFGCKQDDLMSGYKTPEEIKRTQDLQRIMAYYLRLNPEGIAKVLSYMEDLNPKYYREEEKE